MESQKHRLVVIIDKQTQYHVKIHLIIFIYPFLLFNNLSLFKLFCLITATFVLATIFS
jgi:hypothetical protein